MTRDKAIDVVKYNSFCGYCSEFDIYTLINTIYDDIENKQFKEIDEAETRILE